MRGLGKVGRKKDENDLNALCADTEFLKSKTKKYTHTYKHTHRHISESLFQIEACFLWNEMRLEVMRVFQVFYKCLKT